MIDALPLLLGPEGYQISRSVRLRSSASAYFNRTPASAGNRKTWTWSGWVKRGGFANTTQVFFGAFSSNADSLLIYYSNDSLVIGSYSATSLQTTQVFRDPSAWYHIVFALDTTQATASNRMKLYINGVQVSAFSTASYPTQNSDLSVNATYNHTLGAGGGSPQYFFDGYLTEINFIDGQALTPSSFGETDAVTGVWKPKKYTGTYGTNGFYLTFSDNSAATAAAIGKDYSGNGNNWTPNNISVTAGVTYDSMLDVPTQWADGGNGRGNYFVLNPLSASGYTPYSDGNLKYTSSALAAFTSVFTTTGGKWYYECTAGSIATPANFRFGFGALYFANGNIFVGGSVIATVSSYTAGDIIGVATDSDANTVSFYKNNVLQGTYSASLNASMAVALAASAPDSASFNFGQRPFSYTPPSGFKALNTLNLPTPTILKGNQYFDATLYTGNGTSQNVVNSGGFQPDFVWYKDRSVARDHGLFDSLRGALNLLSSNNTSAESSVAGSLTAFNSNGYSIGSAANANGNGETYVGWQWKEGATQGFDIVTYTGTGATRNINHSLGVSPSMMIFKRRDTTGNWRTYHASNGVNGYLLLNSTAASAADTNWTGVTSSTFALNGSGADYNANLGTYVAYLFAEVAGFSKFGSYTGNGSADGPFVFCGFRPRWIMVKITSGGTGFWHLIDTARDTYNQNGLGLYPNSSNAESSDFASDTLSNGFKIRNTQSEINGSGFTYIFAAFAEHPFKNALAR